MKFKLLILFALVFSCKVNRYHPSIKMTVTPEFEKFNITDFNTVKSLKSQQNSQSQWPKRYYFDLGGEEQIYEYDAYKHIISETIKTDQFARIIFHIDEYVDVHKYYYANGNIASKSIGSWLGFGIGKAYLFDKEGTLKEIRDNDEGYHFNYKRVFDFCANNGISLKRINGLPGVQIYKKIDSGIKCWFIKVPGVQFNITVLNGNTGEIVRKFSVPNPIVEG